MRTICCRKFACIRPYIYLYRKKDGAEEYESGEFYFPTLKRNRGITIQDIVILIFVCGQNFHEYCPLPVKSVTEVAQHLVQAMVVA
jgi:hypothetical protein